MVADVPDLQLSDSFSDFSVTFLQTRWLAFAMPFRICCTPVSFRHYPSGIDSADLRHAWASTPELDLCHRGLDLTSPPKRISALSRAFFLP